MADQFIPDPDYPHGTTEYPTRKVFGYARVSTEDQDMALQINALEKHGVDRIFKEKVSAVAKNRHQFNLMLKNLREGDVIVVWKLDRLGRKVVDIAQLGERMEKKGVQLKSITQDIDTTTPMGRVFFYLLAVFAQMERDMISERTKAGMKLKREQGVKFGNPTKVIGQKKLDMLIDIWELKLTINQIAQKHGYKSIATIANYFPSERRAALAASSYGEEFYRKAMAERIDQIKKEQDIE